MDALRSVGLLLGGLGLGCAADTTPQRPPPRPPPPPDLVEEAVEWAAQADPALHPLFAEPVGRRVPEGTYMGLLFYRNPPGAKLGDGHLVALQVRADGTVAVGGVIPRADGWDAVHAVERDVRACIAERRCPPGAKEVPASVHAALERAPGKRGVAAFDEHGHLRATTSAGHGFAQVYDVAWSPEGDGFWVVGVGTGTGLREIGVFLDVPPRAAR